MNRYPVWKYAIIVIALLLGVIYTLPNFFGEAPAVQVSSSKVTFKVDTATLAKVEDALRTGGVPPTLVSLEGASIRARFETTEAQLKAKSDDCDIVSKQLNEVTAAKAVADVTVGQLQATIQGLKADMAALETQRQELIAAQERKVREVDAELATMLGHIKELTAEAAAKSLRLSHCITYASCQGLSLDGVRLLETSSPHFTWKHLYVGCSRCTSSETLQVG